MSPLKFVALILSAVGGMAALAAIAAFSPTGVRYGASPEMTEEVNGQCRMREGETISVPETLADSEFVAV